MNRIIYLFAFVAAGVISINSFSSGSSAAANPLTILAPGTDLVRFNNPPVEIKLRLEGENALGFRALLNGKDVTSLFGPPRSGLMQAVFTAGYLKHGVNNFEARLGAHKVWRSFKVKSLRTDAVADGPIRPGPIAQLNSPGADLWIPIRTRIISGDGTKATDYAIKVGDQTYTAPSLNDGSATGYQALLLDRATLEPISQNANVSYRSAAQPDLISLSGIYGNLKGCGENGCLMVVQSLQTIGYTPWPCMSLDCQYEVNSPGFFFNSLGGSVKLNSANGTTPHTGYSLIANVGPSGAAAGTGYERLTCNQASDCGGLQGDEQIITAGGASAISGALVLDNNLAYTFAYPGRATFSTGTGDSTTQNTITIGATTNGLSYQSEQIPDGYGAFHVVVIYRDSLQLVYQNTFNFDQLDSMTRALDDVQTHGNYLVLISSIGNLWHDNWLDRWANVGKAIERLGGTYSLFVSLQSGDDYSFVGATDTTLGNGAAEASSVITRAIKGLPSDAKTINSNLRGVLAQDRQGNYSVALSRLKVASKNDDDSAFADFSSSLIDAISLQPPTPWPATDTPGRQAAYSYISSKVLGISSGGDLRAGYTNANNKLSFDGWKNTVDNLSCPAGQTFSQVDFTTVQQQLSDELKSVPLIWAYQDNILGVYTDTQSSIGLILDVVHDDVKNSLNPPADAKNETEWQTVFASAQTIIGDLGALAGGPGLKLGMDSVFVATKLAATFANDSNGSPLQNVDHTLDELKEQAVENFTAQQTVIANAFDRILTDGARLKNLGTLLEPSSDGSGNGVPPKIVWDNSQLGNIQKAVERSLRREVFTKLIGSSFEMGHWTNVAEGSSPGVGVLCDKYTGYTTVVCSPSGDCYTYKYCDTPDSHKENWVALPSSAARVGQNYDIWLIGRDVRCSAGKNGGLLGPLFAPLDPNDATKLGIYKPYFFLHPDGSMKVRTNERCSK